MNETLNIENPIDELAAAFDVDKDFTFVVSVDLAPEVKWKQSYSDIEVGPHLPTCHHSWHHSAWCPPESPATHLCCRAAACVSICCLSQLTGSAAAWAAAAGLARLVQAGRRVGLLASPCCGAGGGGGGRQRSFGPGARGKHAIKAAAGSQLAAYCSGMPPPPPPPPGHGAATLSMLVSSNARESGFWRK